MKPFLIILIILLVVLFTVGLPLVLDNCIIGNSFPSNVSNSEWISFFGSYYGAILGGILSLLGIVYTIRFTREQNRTDRELQIRPYFDIRYRDMSIPVHSDTWLGYAQLTVEDGENTECQSNKTGAGLLYLKNVGNGPATNFDCEIVLEDGGITYKGDFHTNNALVNTNSIRPDEEASLSIDIFNSRSAPKAEDITWSVNEYKIRIPSWDYKKFAVPNDFTIFLYIRYRDLLANQFEQKLELRTSYHTMSDYEKDAKYHCDIHLEKIFPPEKVTMSRAKTGRNSSM